MVLTAHFPNYSVLRNQQTTDLFGAIARVLSGYGNPDPLHKLPEMRPPPSLILGAQSGQSPAKIVDAPKIPNGKRKSVGSFVTKVGAILKKLMHGDPPKCPLSNVVEDEDEGGEESYYWPSLPQAAAYSAGATSGGRIPEPN